MQTVYGSLVQKICPQWLWDQERSSPQWRSVFYDTLTLRKWGSLRKCIFEGPYKLTCGSIEAVAFLHTVKYPDVPQQDEAETVHKCIVENKLVFSSSKKEAIFLAFNCFGKFTSRDGESMESYYSRFYKLMNELTRNNLQVTTMQVNVQFLQQLQPEWSRFVTYQNEVNDIRAERIAPKVQNPVSTSCGCSKYSVNFYQGTQNLIRTNTTSSSTRPSASTRHKGKEIAKPVTPQSESVSEEDSDPEQAQRDKDMQKNLALLAKYFKSHGSATELDNYALIARDFWATMQRNSRKPSIKTTRLTRKSVDVPTKAEQGVPLRSYREESVLHCIAWNRYKTMMNNKVLANEDDIWQPDVH
ncbi:hypothetical protein Tco_0918385 [Tanacetum coccineum]